MAVTAAPATSCAGLTGGASAASQLSRSLERLLEEAALSGELRLSGRKLRELPRRARELRDTVRADLSKNRLSELPEEVTTYVYMERLLLAHNSIRHLPDTVSCLQSLTYLDLSGNQLTEVPREVCLMPLEVLLLSENRLAALPKEIGKMSALAELDAAHNRLAHVPLSIGELQALRALNLSNNQLGLLPLQITYLKLETLDVSCNCISSLPLELRHMSSLVTLQLDNNPLVSPPTTVCMRGRVHIFKYLESLESKDCATGRRGAADDARRAAKHSSYVGAPASAPSAAAAKHSSYVGAPASAPSAAAASANATLDCVRHRTRHVDSGYSTSDGDKRCSNDVLGEGAAPGAGAVSVLDGTASSGRSTPSTPSTLSPGAALSRAHSLSSESPLAGLRISPEGYLSNGDDKTKLSHQQTYRQYKEALRQQRQQDVYRPRSDQPSPSPDADSPHGGSPAHKLSHSTPHSPVANGHHLASYRPASSTPTASQLPGSPLLHSTPRRFHAQAPVNGNTLPDPAYKTEENKRPVQKVVPSRNVNKINLSNGNVEYQNGRIPGSGSLPRMRSATSPDGDAYIKPVSPTKSPTLGVAPARIGVPVRSSANGGDAKLLTTTVSYLRGASAKPPGASGRLAWSKDVPPDKLSFTMKREFDKQKEELDLLQQLRAIIESRLKMSLPEELAPVLADGVVLCHLANHVRPRSVASVHVPSVAQPKLTMARCRRNVDNFLEACRKIGVEEEEICTADDVLCRREAPLARTLAALLAHATPSPPHHPRRAPHPYAQLHVHTDFTEEGARECHIDYFQRRHRCTDDRIVSNFNGYGGCTDYAIDEADEYQLHLQNNNDDISHAYKESARSDKDPYALGYNGDAREHVTFNEETYEQVKFNGDAYEQNIVNGDERSQFIGEQKSNGDIIRHRVHFVTPYVNGGGTDEVDSAQRYVRGNMSLHIQHNLNASLNETKTIDSDISQTGPACVDPALDNTLVTFLCLGGFLLTALLLYIFPLQ